MGQLSYAFIDALQRFETDNDSDRLVALFASDATLSNPIVTYDSATQFWTSYREAFNEIRSTFVQTAEVDGMLFLEWQSEGRIKGDAISYKGVSVLEFDDGKIVAFRAYFDPTRLVAVSKRSATLPDEDSENAKRDAADRRAGGGYGG